MDWQTILNVAGIVALFVGFFFAALAFMLMKDIADQLAQANVRLAQMLEYLEQADQRGIYLENLADRWDADGRIIRDPAPR